MGLILSRTLTVDEVIALGDAAHDSIGSFAVGVTEVSGTVAITPKGRISGSGVVAAEYQTLAYTVGSTGVVTAAATPISAEGIYWIRADGCDVYLDFNETGGGSCKIQVAVMDG
jgi:hypothetical protein